MLSTSSAPNIPIPKTSAKKKSSTTEEFIGSNILNKIGIAVFVLGVGFGVKYAIDHQLLNPMTRILLGYFTSILLVIIAYRLKKDYSNFSAVLLSGGMATLYFITYAAYDFYGFLSQTAAFVIMVTFTVFTVYAALQYAMEVIGIIGLVGAYAVPFLLSDGSGKVLILYSYMTIINAGILFLSFKKYWKRLYYFSFIVTWLIFTSWFLKSYEMADHLWLCLTFSTIFFLIFYVTFLVYKLLRKESFEYTDIGFMLVNSFLHFGIGYSALAGTVNGDQFL